MSEQKLSPSALVQSAPFRFAPPVLAALILVGYVSAMLNDFEYDIGHFRLTSKTFILCVAVYVLAFLFSVIQSALLHKRTAFTAFPDNTGALNAFASVLGMWMCLYMAWQNLTNLDSIAASTMAGGMSGIPPAKLYLWSSIAGLFLAASLILRMFPKFSRHPLTAVCTILGAFSVNIAMFAAYFDFEVPLNSPVRNLTTLMEASVLLFLLSEARLTIAKDSKKLPTAFQFLCSTLAATIALGISLAGAIYRLVALGSIPGPEPNLRLPRLILYACLGLSALERTFAYRKALRDLSPREIRAAKEAARSEKNKNRGQNADNEPSKE